MKLSCCSLRRISRTRNRVFKIIPAMIRPKKITPNSSSTPSRQLRITQLMFRATAKATRHEPRTTKNATAFWRLATRMAAYTDCTADLSRCGAATPGGADRNTRISCAGNSDRECTTETAVIWVSVEGNEKSGKIRISYRTGTKARPSGTYLQPCQQNKVRVFHVKHSDCEFQDLVGFDRRQLVRLADGRQLQTINLATQ